MLRGLGTLEKHWGAERVTGAYTRLTRDARHQNSAPLYVYICPACHTLRISLAQLYDLEAKAGASLAKQYPETHQGWSAMALLTEQLVHEGVVLGSFHVVC